MHLNFVYSLIQSIIEKRIDESSTDNVALRLAKCRKVYFSKCMIFVKELHSTFNLQTNQLQTK